MAVVEHGAIDDPIRLLSEVLQVLVVGRDDTETPVSVEAVEERLGDRPADLGLGTATELVDQEDRALVAVLDEKFHVHQVGTVGTQVVLDALLVADIDEHPAEQARARAFVQGDQESALQHVLQEPDRFEADRLTAGVGAGDQQDPSLFRQLDIQRDDAFALFFQGDLGDPMSRLRISDCAVTPVKRKYTGSGR